MSLFCVVHGRNTFFTVRPAIGSDIDDLKTLIHSEGIEKPTHVLSRRLTLWKLKEPPLIIQAADMLASLPKLATDLPKIATKLEEPSRAVTAYFPLIENDRLHIIVEVPTSSSSHFFTSDFHERPAKRSRKAEPDASLLTLYTHFWGGGDGLFSKYSVQVPDPLSLEVVSESGLEEGGSGGGTGRGAESDAESGSGSGSDTDSGNGLRSASGSGSKLTLTVIEHPLGPEQVLPFGLPKLLVPTIYETFWDVLESEDVKWQKLVSSPGIDRFSRIEHATIITGQRGIGKTVFLIYLLLRRLINGQKTIYCDRKYHCHIFDDTGVRRLALYDDTNYAPELDDPHCLALVNLGDCLKHVPRLFYPAKRKARVVVATPPDSQHWSTFSHEHLARFCWMPTWSWGSLYFASLIHENKDYSSPPDMDHCQRLRHAYSIFHGIPRRCFTSLTESGLEAEMVLIDGAVSGIRSVENFMDAITRQHFFGTSTTQHLVRVEPADKEWGRTRIEVLSSHVAGLVFDHLRLFSMSRLSADLAPHLANPYARAKAGLLFEHAAHFAIRQGLTLEMTRLSERSKEQVSVIIPHDGKSKRSRYYSLDIREQAGSQNVHKDFLNVYMTPISKIEPAIDALFISPDYKTTLLFQMTVFEHHSIDFLVLDRAVNSLPATAKKNICIVFIIPTKDIFGNPYPGIQSVQEVERPEGVDVAKFKKFKKIPQYVCRLDIDAKGLQSLH